MSNPVLETLKLPVKENGVITPTVFDIPQGTVTEEMLNEAEGTKADAIVRSASGDIASYDDGGDLPMKSLKVNIVPKQSGTGDPSPQNIRPISGTNEVNVYQSGADTSDYETITITLPQTVYGGTPDVVSGKLSIEWVKRVFNGDAEEDWRAYPGEATWVYSYNGLRDNIPNHNITDTTLRIANLLKSVDNLGASTPPASFAFSNASSYRNVYVKLPSDIADVDAWKTYLASNNLEIVYKVYAPTEIDLTPTEVKSLLGDNNVWSDSGTVEVEYRADTSLVINKILEALD